MRSSNSFGYGRTNDASQSENQDASENASGTPSHEVQGAGIRRRVFRHCADCDGRLDLLHRTAAGAIVLTSLGSNAPQRYFIDAGGALTNLTPRGNLEFKRLDSEYVPRQADGLAANDGDLAAVDEKHEAAWNGWIAQNRAEQLGALIFINYRGSIF